MQLKVGKSTEIGGCPHLSLPDDQGVRIGRDKRRLLIAIVLCFVFMVAEIVGGLLSGSLAVVTDAAHLLSDIAGFLISLFALTWSTKPANTRMSFGYHRAEILGALLSIALVWALTIWLVMEAVDRIKNPQAINAPIMMGVAVIGLFVNIVIAFTLHDHPHDDEHHIHAIPEIADIERSIITNTQQSQQPNQVKRALNMNIRAAMIHAIGDIIQSAGVLIAAIVIWKKPEWSIADPLCTFLFSILVFASTVMVSRDAIHILMEGSPKEVDLDKLEKDLITITGVKSIHDLHVWSLAAGKPALTMHVLRLPDSDPDQVLIQCQSLLCNRFNIHHATVQVEARVDSRFHCHSHLPSSEEQFGDNRLPW